MVAGAILGLIAGVQGFRFVFSLCGSLIIVATIYLFFKSKKEKYLMYTNDLPRCAPEEAGLSSRQIMDCIKALNHDLTSMHGFMAARHGKVFTKCWWAPYSPDLVHCNHSFGKSYTATAIRYRPEGGPPLS